MQAMFLSLLFMLVRRLCTLLLTLAGLVLSCTTTGTEKIMVSLQGNYFKQVIEGKLMKSSRIS